MNGKPRLRSEIAEKGVNVDVLQYKWREPLALWLATLQQSELLSTTVPCPQVIIKISGKCVKNTYFWKETGILNHTLHGKCPVCIRYESLYQHAAWFKFISWFIFIRKCSFLEIEFGFSLNHLLPELISTTCFTFHWKISTLYTNFQITLIILNSQASLHKC